MEKEIRSRRVKLLSFNTILTFTEERLSRLIIDIEDLNLKFMHRERMSVNYDRQLIAPFIGHVRRLKRPWTKIRVTRSDRLH